MTRFWRNWLKVWCWAVSVFGLILAGAGLQGTSGAARLLMRLLNGGVDVTFDPALHFAIALMGCVTLGWGLTLSAVFGAAYDLGERGGRTWRAVTTSLLVWFAIDSALSIATGFGLNAVSNAVFLAAYLLPVLRSGVLQPTRTSLGGLSEST